MAMDDIAWGQIEGRRGSQQDRADCLSWPNGYHLLLLGDGLGGHVAGDIASATVIESFRDAFVGSSDQSPRERLLQALQTANIALFDRIQEDPRLIGMGTTLVVVAVEKSSLYWVSVGDSPLWLFRDGEMRRLNENHSVGGILINALRMERSPIRKPRNLPEDPNCWRRVLGEDIKLVDAPTQPLNSSPEI